MKKWLIGIIAVVVIAVIAVFGAKILFAPKAVVLAEILPQDVAFYYSVQNLETIWKDVKTSNFWRDFSGLKLWEDIQVAGGIEDIKTQFKENVGVELTEDNFLKLAGQQLAVAVIPGAEQAAPPKILILSQAKTKQALLDITNPIIDKVKKSDPAKVEDIQHKGKTIIHIKAASGDQPDIYIAILDNILATGIGDTISPIQKIIDLSAGNDKDSLSTSESYKKIISLIGSKKTLAGLFYMDFTKMKKYLQALSLPGQEGAPAPAAAGMDTINFIGGWTEIKEGLITKLYIYPNTEALSPDMQKMWQEKPQVPQTLKFTPEKVILYIASNSLNLQAIWNMWMSNLKAQAQAPEQAQPILDNISSFEKDWGLSITNDILPLAGNEVAFVFSDINTEGIIPLPRLGLALKVTDKTKTDQLIADLIRKNNEKAAEEEAKLEQMTESAAKETAAAETASQESTSTESPLQTAIRFKLNLTDESYEEHPMKTLQLPLVGAGVAPGYTYIDNFLVIGLTTKTLQEMLDVKNGKLKPLTQDPTYEKISATLPKENNQCSFINMERLIDIAVGVCNWLVTFQQLSIPQGPAPEDPKELELFNQQKAAAESTIATINNSVVPLLKTLKAIKFIATASVNKQNYIEQTLVLRVEDI